MLEITELRKTFRARRNAPERDVVAIDNLSVTVGQGDFFTLLGPSGCGKTTTLRAVAGLELPDSGEIRVGGRVLHSTAQKVFLRAN
ncbi:MAG: ATP-binding cassette domain-containing protein, partial [Actinophytocola sp.]|nr:ATP-binding cassette domain-containing protein [Actinophytocola sp.]